MIRLYEDIDGCLNADHNARVWRTESDTDDAGFMQAWVHPEHDDRGVHRGRSDIRYRMRWNSRLVKALNELPVEFVWTTTWREDARAVGTAMELLHDPQRVLHPLNGETTFPSIEWKFDAILREQENDPSPFIAVDDEWDSKPYYRRVLQDLGGLVIAPDFNFGVTPAHIEQMKEYIAGQSV